MARLLVGGPLRDLVITLAAYLRAYARSITVEVSCRMEIVWVW